MDERFYRATMKIGGGTLFGRLAFSFLVLCAIAFGAAVGLLFVYAGDLPEVHALEDYRPIVETELYADDGQSIGTFALQRRILVTYPQIPKVLREAILTTEDQHFEQHWGVTSRASSRPPGTTSPAVTSPKAPAPSPCSSPEDSS